MRLLVTWSWATPALADSVSVTLLISSALSVRMATRTWLSPTVLTLISPLSGRFMACTAAR